VERVEKLALAQVPDLERTVEAAGEDVVVVFPDSWKVMLLMASAWAG
jgi:hypothetical protein